MKTITLKISDTAADTLARIFTHSCRTEQATSSMFLVEKIVTAIKENNEIVTFQLKEDTE
tara:strand:+ start:398 stop:577 length:180 start_codon:yes stop_codon:yes gene_type:complete